MEIEYILTPEDIVAFNRYHFKTSPSSRRAYWMGYFWGILAALILFLIFGRGSWWNALFPAIFLVLYLVSYPLTIQRQISRIGKQVAKEGRNRGTLTKHTMVITPAGLMEKTPVGESQILWEGVERVAANDTHIFIYVSATSAHVIPRAAFASAQQAEEFLQTARRYEQATNGRAGQA